MIKIGIVGCTGRMGRMLLREVLATPGAQLAGGTDVAEIGADLGVLAGQEPLGLKVGTDAHALFVASDVMIDFTTPKATMAHVAVAQSLAKAMVIGTTGLGAAEHSAIALAAKKAAIVQAVNMSLGVNVLLALTHKLAASLGTEYDIEIVEMHHRHKVDAPSGTALALGEAAAGGRNVRLDQVSVRARDGQVGARRTGDIGFATLRGGDVAGDHTVIFAGDGERIELTHKASSREVFAKGAVRAALWTEKRPPGLYSMIDVLGLD